MDALRRFTLVVMASVFAFCASARAVTLETVAVDLDLPDDWTFTEDAEGMLVFSNVGEKALVKIATTPGRSLKERRRIFEGIQAEMRRFYFDEPQKSQNVRIIVPHTTISLPGSVAYSEMVYEFKNNPGPMAAFSVVRGHDFIIGFAMGKDAIGGVRAMLKRARWK